MVFLSALPEVGSQPVNLFSCGLNSKFGPDPPRWTMTSLRTTTKMTRSIFLWNVSCFVFFLEFSFSCDFWIWEEGSPHQFWGLFSFSCFYSSVCSSWTEHRSFGCNF